MLITHLGLKPESGVVIPGTGGVRKLRWAIPGKGKRGGARVIYYFHNTKMPVFALHIYGKNEKSDVSPAEKRSWKNLVDVLVREYGGKAE
jgi:hypothetical protein